MMIDDDSGSEWSATRAIFPGQLNRTNWLDVDYRKSDIASNAIE
jgi:hypothetical protein